MASMAARAAISEKSLSLEHISGIMAQTPQARLGGFARAVLGDRYVAARGNGRFNFSSFAWNTR